MPDDPDPVAEALAAAAARETPVPPEGDDWDLWDAAEQTKKLPTRFTTRIFISPDGPNLRISFGELIKDETVYHTALIVPGADALDMGHLLTRMAQANVNLQIANLRGLADFLEQQTPRSGEEPHGE